MTTSWWYTYPSSTNMSLSVGMMTFPIYGKIWKNHPVMFQSPPDQWCRPCWCSSLPCFSPLKSTSTASCRPSNAGRDSATWPRLASQVEEVFGDFWRFLEIFGVLISVGIPGFRGSTFHLQVWWIYQVWMVRPKCSWLFRQLISLWSARTRDKRYFRSLSMLGIIVTGIFSCFKWFILCCTLRTNTLIQRFCFGSPYFGKPTTLDPCTHCVPHLGTGWNHCAKSLAFRENSLLSTYVVDATRNFETQPLGKIAFRSEIWDILW